MTWSIIYRCQIYDWLKVFLQFEISKPANCLSNPPCTALVTIRFEGSNHGTVAHEVVLEEAGVVDDPLELNGEAPEIEDVDPSETKSAVWTITDPGPYQLACHERGHEGGMALSEPILSRLKLPDFTQRSGDFNWRLDHCR